MAHTLSILWKYPVKVLIMYKVLSISQYINEDEVGSDSMTLMLWLLSDCLLGALLVLLESALVWRYLKFAFI